MRGEIISVDGLSGDGLISGDDGARYSFVAASTRASVRTGDKVDFVAADGVATEIMIMAGAGSRPAPAMQPYDAAYNFGWAMFAFDDRLRRSHFWISWGILFAVGFVAQFIPFFGAFVVLALLWPHLAIGAKRLHDMGHSGWLIAIPWGVMIAGWVAAALSFGFSALANPAGSDSLADLATVGPAVALIMVSWLVGVGFWLWMGIADGQRGRNRFGRNPKHPHDDTADTFA